MYVCTIKVVLPAKFIKNKMQRNKERIRGYNHPKKTKNKNLQSHLFISMKAETHPKLQD